MGKRNWNAVRFWTMWNGTMVKLRVAKGETVVLAKSEETDEGWRSVCEAYTYEEGVLTCDYVSRERDCDGLYERFVQSECGPAWTKYEPYIRERWAFDGFRSDPETYYLLPRWEGVRERNRDHTAEAAGY